MDYTITPIGHLLSPFKEKFGVPRQSGLVENRCEIVIDPPYNVEAAFKGLDEFSHIWVEFLFHQNIEAGWKPSVRPPRLGGNQKLGVFATRSPFRPNGLGLSVVQLLEVCVTPDGISLWVSGADMVDGTPVIDIKPYLPYADTLSHAIGGFAPSAPKATLRITWSESAKRVADSLAESHQGLCALIESTIALDPRPQYHKDSGKQYGIRLYDLDIRWQVSDDIATIIEVVR